jgi:hypothetical protein
LQKFADDMNAALKAQASDMASRSRPAPWEQQMTSMVSTVYVSNCGHDHDINVDGRGLVSVSFRSPLRCYRGPSERERIGADSERRLVVATTFDTESEAQAVAAELNAAAGRERQVRYHVERYREKWAIARQSMRTYWGWDEFITRGSDGTLS